MRAEITNAGYARIGFYIAERKIHRSVHALVASAFLGPRPLGYHINHIDGVKLNNCPSNLEYVTPKENTIHAVKFGLHPSGERNKGGVPRKLSPDDVRAIRVLYKPRICPHRKLAILFGVTEGTIRNVIKGNTYAYVD